MRERVLRTYEEHVGPGAASLVMLGQAFDMAMRPRVEQLDDDHHPAYLHPGRTAVILMDDLGLHDPEWLAAGVLLDSDAPEFQIPDEEVADFSDRVRALRAELPRPDDPHLLESLLALSDEALAVTLAERLDHLRHLHLRPDQDKAAQVYAHAADTYSRVAARSHPVLARRYAWWTRKFGAKYAT